MLRFGLGKDAQEPLLRSGHATTDARIMTYTHALSAALPYFIPQALDAWEQTLSVQMMNPLIGFEASLLATCGDIEAADAEWSSATEDCLRNWYNADPSPARMGQIIGYEMMFFRIRDGFNSLGTDGGCIGGEKYCPLYRDITGYDPNKGACTRESIS